MLLKSKRIATLLMSMMLVFGSALSLGGCGEVQEEIPELLEPANVSEVMASVEKRDVYHVLSYESYVIPVLKELSFEDSGKLDNICVGVGDEVTEGQVLASLKSGSETYDELVDQLAKMRADNAYYNRQLEIEIEKKRIYSESIASLNLQLKQQKELQEVDENYLVSRINTERAKLSAAEIVAPFTGTVVAVMPELREDSDIIKDQPVIVVADTTQGIVTCEYMSKATVDSFNRIYAVIDGAEYELTYIPYEDGELAKFRKDGEDFYSRFLIEGVSEDMMGLYASIIINNSCVYDVLTVPNNAVHYEGSATYVYVDDNGKKTPVSVTIGVKGAMYTEITEGLTEGEVVYIAD